MNIQAEYLVPRIKEQLNKSIFDCHCTVVWCTYVIQVYNELRDSQYVFITIN